MIENAMITLPWGGEISFFVFLVIMGSLVAAVWTEYRCSLNRAGAGRGILFIALTAVLSLGLGRAIYCAVRYVDIFYDPMGDFIGLAPFLDLSIGGFSVIGVILGVLLAAALTGLICRGKALALLDAAAVPGMALFAGIRFIEPMIGLGHGDFISYEPLCRFPFAIENGMGEYLLSVCFFEAALGALIMLILLFASFRCRKEGTLCGIALALLCVTQILPESLQRVDVLYLFIFARVSQIGYAVILFGTLLAFLIRGMRRGLSGKTVAVELLLLLLGIGICGGAEFALDKTNLSNWLVYGGMLVALIGMGVLVLRRIIIEDRFDA